MSKKEITKDLVVNQVTFTPAQMQVMTMPTPARFIKTKPGRGRRVVKFVEGGYMTNQANRIFGPMNWSFKILERGYTERKTEKNTDGEVWVYGEVSVHDHKNGFVVTKGQHGQHPVHSGVPIGDAYKAAATDAEKKALSLFGIALDVYWGSLDTSGGDPKPPVQQAPKKQPKQDVFTITKQFIQQNEDRVVLGNMLQRMETADTLTVAQKHQLKKMVYDKLGIHEEETTV